jgi:arylsulfatase A-like enzyme
MMTRTTPPPGRYLLLGVCHGAIAWLCYGIVELCCLAILPRMVETGYEYRAYDARFSGLALAVYAAIGAALGLALGYIAGKASSLRNANGLLAALHNVALSGILLANVLILWRNSPFSPILLVVNLILVIAACGFSLTGGDLARQCRGFTLPWLPVMSYALCQWLGGWLGNGRVPAQRITVYGVLLTVGLWAIAWVAGKATPPGDRVLPVRAMAAVLGMAVVCCAVTASLKTGVYRVSESARPPAAGKPNVILISLDTVRADHLSVYGYERNTTPHLKEFAAESTVFKRAASSSDMTLPSHASMFSGLYPSQHGAHFSVEHRLGVPLDARFLPLAERLRNKGFWTGGVVANGGYLSVAFGLNHGFEYWDQRLPAIVLAPVPPYWLRGRLRDLAVRFVPTSQLDRVSRSAGEINDAVFAALGQRPRDGRAFFLFVNYMDAHVPYIPPAPYDTMFPGKDPAFTESRYMATYRDVIAHDRKIDDRAHAHLVSQYDGGIAYLDTQLAALFARLKAAGLYENSAIIVTSDHGEALGERNCMDHGGMSLYEEQIHVPLLIKFPQSRGGAVVEQPVSSVDILPTVLDAVGLPVPANVPGQSLRGPIPEGREVISESFPVDGRISRMPRGSTGRTEASSQLR